MFKYFLYRLGQFLTNHLSLKTSYKLANFLSTLHYYWSPNDRRAVRNNLRIIRKSKEHLSVLTKEVFLNFGRYLVEFFRMGKMIDSQYIRDHVKIKNLERIDAALKGKKGVILLTAHIGNWELGGVLLSILGYKLTAIALPHKERPVNDLFNLQRESRGITIIPTHLAVRKCLECLAENEIVALVGDRDFSNSGEVMDFLGGKAIIPKGAAILSEKTGAPIVPSFLVREKEGFFTLSFHEPIYPPAISHRNVEKETLFLIMKQYISVIEAKIREYPTQWLMFREFCVK